MLYEVKPSTGHQQIDSGLQLLCMIPYPRLVFQHTGDYQINTFRNRYGVYIRKSLDHMILLSVPEDLQKPTSDLHRPLG